MSAMAIVSISPLGEGESVSKYVAEAVSVIKNSGLSWELNPMGTVIEGERLTDVLKVVNDATEALAECNRISVVVKIDYRKDKPLSMTSKVDSVMKKLK